MFSIFRWKPSGPHKLLLSRFLAARNPKSLYEDWQPVLNEPLEKAVRRFIKKKYLRKAAVIEKLNSFYTKADLSRYLSKTPSNLKKAEIADRLLTDHPWRAKWMSRKKAFICSDKGREIAEEFKQQLKADELVMQAKAIEFLEKWKPAQACRIRADYNASLIFSPGMNFDWSKYSYVKTDAETLNKIYGPSPETLLGCDHKKINSLKVAAAIIHLFGKTAARRHLNQIGFIGEYKASEAALNLLQNAYGAEQL